MPLGCSPPVVAAVSGQDAASRECPNQLFGEERVAVTLPDNVRNHSLRGRVVAGQIANEPVDIVARQLRERQLVIMRKREPWARPARPVVQHDEKIGPACRLDDGIQEILTGLIQPVQVLEDNHRRHQPQSLDHAVGYAE